jgi:superfamily I DNA/RNA helicase
VIAGVELGLIPRAQYGAVLIDEGHDFEAEWLKLIVHMIDPETNSLLLLYDDAQSIYKKKKSLDFTLSSVGIQARGRTTILKLNYRNTREILNFAFDFAKDYLQEKSADEDSFPLIKPEVGGNSGQKPVLKVLPTKLQELNFICACLQKWHKDGVPWSQMAVIYCEYTYGAELHRLLNRVGVPNAWLASSVAKRKYDPRLDQVLLITRQSSKGLEFPRVIVSGVGSLKDEPESTPEEARLLYVAMTRAQEALLLTASSHNHYVERFMAID